MALKRKVQDLIKAGYVNFDYNALEGPNITNNPLPNHPEPKINALTEDSTVSVKTKVSNVKTPLENVYKTLIQAKILHPRETEMIKGEKDQNGARGHQYCQYHADWAEHTIQGCAEFQKMVQDLINEKEIEFSTNGEHSIDVITGYHLFRGPFIKWA